MRSWPFLLFPFLTAAVLAGEPDRAAIHDIQQAYWNSIATMEVKGDEFVLDGSLKPKEGPQIVHQEFELLYGSGARLSFRRISKAADGGIRGSYQFREDGRAKYGIVTFAGEPDAIDEVAIQSQTDRPGHYEGEMCIAFWAWMPAGKPVHVWLDDGATLRSSTAKAGREVVTLAAQHHGRSLLIDLDPDHDWLPERVELVGSHRVQVRKFGSSPATTTIGSRPTSPSRLTRRMRPPIPRLARDSSCDRWS